MLILPHPTNIYNYSRRSSPTSSIQNQISLFSIFNGDHVEVWNGRVMMRTLLDFENDILDLFEKNRITIQDAKIILWTLLTAIYEDELIEEPQYRETILSNIKTEGQPSRQYSGPL